MLVDSDPVLEEAPSAIDDLGAALGLEFATRVWVFVGGDSDIGWQLPNPPALHLHALLAMTHMVMQHTTHLQFVRLGGVGTQDNRTILKVFGC